MGLENALEDYISNERDRARQQREEQERLDAIEAARKAKETQELRIAAEARALIEANPMQASKLAEDLTPEQVMHACVPSRS